MILAYQTIFQSHIELLNTKDSSITYDITVYNSSDYTYYFDGYTYLEDEQTYSNENIAFKVDGINNYDLIHSKEYKTFSITFSYKDGVSLDNTLNSTIQFLFYQLKLADGINDLPLLTAENIDEFINYTDEDFAGLYGGNDSKIKYTEDDAMLFGDDYPILYKKIDSETLFTDNVSVYLTIKADVMQSANTEKYPIGIVSIGGGDGFNFANTIIWIGLYKGYLHVYAYRPNSQRLCEYCNYEHIETAFISYDVTQYTNKIFNIQVVATVNSDVYLYVNGKKVKNTTAGDNVNVYEYITIGDLRPMRGLKYYGNIYDYVIYDRVLTDKEIYLNWIYSKTNYNINY